MSSSFFQREKELDQKLIRFCEEQAKRYVAQPNGQFLVQTFVQDPVKKLSSALTSLQISKQ